MGSNPIVSTIKDNIMTNDEIERQAEVLYYEFSRERGLQYPWNMLDDNTKGHWRRRVQRDI